MVLLVVIHHTRTHEVSLCNIVQFVLERWMHFQNV